MKNVVTTLMAAAAIGSFDNNALFVRAQEEPQQNIVEYLVGNADLSKFVNLCAKADLIVELSEGPKTVFAPTNDALKKMPVNLMMELEQPGYIAHLTEFLKSHVTESTVVAASVTEPITVTTMSGESFPLTIDESLTTQLQQVGDGDGQTADTINRVAIDGAEILIADIAATNGVVHVLADPIMPRWETQSLMQSMSVMEGIGSLNTVLQQTGINLAGDNGTFTVFAPTNEAVAALDSAVKECLAENDNMYWKRVLEYHVVPDMVPLVHATTTETTYASGSYPTVYGEPVTVNGADGTVNNGAANIVDSDSVLALNGIGHTIDKVLIPSTLQSAIDTCVASKGGDGDDEEDDHEGHDHGDGNLDVDVLGQDGVVLSERMPFLPTLSTLVRLLDRADLLDAFSADGPFTIFAPNNGAFAAVPDATMECIEQDDAVLSEILKYHVLRVELTAAEVPALGEAAVLGTLQGEPVDISGVNLTVNAAAAITGPDAIVADNGVLHEINSVLVPPSAVAGLTECWTGALEEMGENPENAVFEDGISVRTASGAATVIGTLFCTGLATAAAAWIALM